MVDESTTLSTKTALIVYIRIPFEGKVCDYFFDLIEVKGSATGLNI